MLRQAIIAPALILCGLFFAPDPAAAGDHPHSRQGFFIGLGLGWGNAGAELVGLEADRENSASGNFRLGWAAADNVTIGLETSSWVKSYEIEGTSADLTLSGTVTTFAVTLFPRNIGLYVRGGLGVAAGTVEIDDGGSSVSHTDTGVGLLAASGYEWRLTRKFALGPQVQYAYLDIDGEGTESVDFVSITAQATWYW